MRCADCGARVPEGAFRCPDCGATLALTAPTQPTAATRPATMRDGDGTGVPTDRYVPSQYGPPVLAERSPYTMSRPREVPRVRRPIGYRPIVPPPPPPPRRRGGCLRLALLTVTLLVLAGIAASMVSGRAASWHLGPLGPLGITGFFAHATPTARPAATAIPCAVAPVDQAAASRLSHVQMTTGLANAATKDYRPLDNVTTFHAGHPAYITFQLATSAAGIVSVNFCTAGGNTVGTLEVPAGSSGRYGEFSVPLDSLDLGQGMATLTWNGAVAAEARFTVVR